MKTPLVEKQIPEQARDLGLTEEQVVKQVMLKETVDGEFTTTLDVAEVALLFASFPSKIARDVDMATRRCAPRVHRWQRYGALRHRFCGAQGISPRISHCETQLLRFSNPTSLCRGWRRIRSF